MHQKTDLPSTEGQALEPFIARIPESVWRDSETFNEILTDRFLPFMRVQTGQSLHELLDRLMLEGHEFDNAPEEQGFALNEDPNWDAYTKINAAKRDRIKIFLTIFLTHSHFEPLVLYTFAQRLSIPDYWILRNLVKCGDSPLFRFVVLKMMTERTLEPVLSHPEAGLRIYWQAAAHGQHRLLDFLNLLVPGTLTKFLTEGDTSCFKVAASNGHQAVLEFFARQVSGIELQRLVAASYQDAAASGQLDILEYFARLFPDHVVTFIQGSEGNYPAYQVALQYGHIAVAEYLATECDEVAMARADHFTTYWLAAEEQQLESMRYLEWVLRDHPADLLTMVTQSDNSPLRIAIAHGDRDMRDHLLSHREVLEYAEIHYPRVAQEYAGQQRRMTAAITTSSPSAYPGSFLNNNTGPVASERTEAAVAEEVQQPNAEQEEQQIGRKRTRSFD